MEEQIIQIDDYQVIKNPKTLKSGDIVISFRTKTKDTIHLDKDGRPMLVNASYSWPCSFKPEFYGKIISDN